MGNRFFVVLLLSTVLLACESSSMTKGSTATSIEMITVEKKVNAFFAALDRGDQKELQSLYPAFHKLNNHQQSKLDVIHSISENDSIIAVSAHHTWLNGRGDKVGKEVRLFFHPTNAGDLTLFDSEGLAAFEKMEYLFGKKTGCIIAGTDTTDQQLANAMAKVRLLLPEKALEIYVELKQGVQVKSWSWKPDDNNSVFGDGVVYNGSPYTIDPIKYKITYYKQNGDTIATDAGTVAYHAINAGDSSVFTFYTSNVGKPAKAKIELLFEDELVFAYLLKKNWTGKECEEFFKKHP